MDVPRCLLIGHRRDARSLTLLGNSPEEGNELRPTAGMLLPTATFWGDPRGPAANLPLSSAASTLSPTLSQPHLASWESPISLAGPSRNPVESAASHESPSRVLFVDDDIHLRIASARFLARSGYVVETAPDGLAAWRTLMPGRFDLLITDHEMPHLTGLELARKILGAKLPVPIILATGSPPIRDPEESAWKAIVAILIKPISPGDLLSTVTSVLRGHRTEASNAILDSPPLESASNTARTAGLEETRDRFREIGDESRR
jgi:CheY-like chemotaxis protein